MSLWLHSSATHKGPVMPRHVELSTEPTQEPVSVEDVRLWAVSEIESQSSGILHRDDEIVRGIVIPGIRRAVEGWTGKSLITQTRKAYFDGIDLDNNVLKLPYGPLQSVSSITYYTTDSDTEQTYSSDNYYEITGDRSEVALNQGSIWPSDLRDYDSVIVTYVAGYGAGSIGTPDYQGTGANGEGNYLLSTGGAYCGSTDVTFRVSCASGTTFNADNNSQLNYFQSGTTIDGAYQHLQLGVYVKFPTTTGYATTDYWDIACTGHGIPGKYQAAMMQLIKYVMASDQGFVNERLNQVLENADFPPAVKLLLGGRVRC